MIVTTTFIRIASGALVLGVAGVALMAPASAIEPVGDLAASPVATSPYAQPLAALGGQTLAQYLAAHRALDPRLRGF